MNEPINRKDADAASAGPLFDDEKTMAAEPNADGPGTIIGRYKLREKIGEGGYGSVFVADQETPVRRRVALKIIKLGMDTKSVVARFEAERQALAMMDHPNIAKVFDAGSTASGRPFFVMELVRGVKITEYCDTNNLSTRERLDLFIKVCKAVQHAHQKGIIHRDLKPSNILVTLHDGAPIPKVIDFGIAKATEGRLTDLTIYTELHQFLGTPTYMSPEQAEMSGMDIDTRTDIYSLGVLLYELLTGKTPFETSELIAAGLDTMRRTIREKEPARPSTRLSSMKAEELTTTAKRRQCEAPKLITLLRGDLDWIAMKCLEKDRVRRYDSATGLAMDLQRHLNSEAVLARPPSTVYRFQRLVRRNKLVFAASGAIAAALIFGLVLSLWMFHKERQGRQRAVAEEKIQRAMTQMGKAEQLGMSVYWQDKPDDSERQYREAISIWKKTTPELLDSLNELVIVLQKQGKTMESAAATAQIAELKTREELIDWLQGLALVLQNRGKSAESLAAYQEALALQRKLSGDLSPEVTKLLLGFADQFWKNGDYAQAQKICDEGLAIERQLPADRRDTAALFGTLSEALADRRAGKTNTVRPLAGWGTVNDFAGDCMFDLAPGRLTVKVPGKIHDLSANYPSWLARSAPRVLQEVEGDFTAQVKVTGEFDPGNEPVIPRRSAFYGAGLLLWASETNYLRLESDVWKREDNVPHSYNPLFEYWKDNKAVIQASGQDPWVGGSGVYHKLVRKGNVVTAFFSRDGSLWIELRSGEVEFPKRIQVGVAAISTSRKPFVVEFSEFKITKLAPSD